MSITAISIRNRAGRFEDPGRLKAVAVLNSTMEESMKEMLKNVLYAGIGAAFLTKEKIEELKGDLIEKGKMSQEEGKQFVDDLLRRSEKAKDQLELWINKRVEDRVNQLNLATKDEIAELRRKIEELQVALNRDTGE
jgi:polyhydroxyalkanoate synthesis regulator phasin